MKVRLGLLVMCLATVGLSAAEGPDVPVAERAKGAQRVVVAKATDSWSSCAIGRMRRTSYAAPAARTSARSRA